MPNNNGIQQNMERKQRAPRLTSDVHALDWIDHQKCYRENYALYKETILKSINHILKFYWMFKDWELDAKHWKYTIKSFHILVKLVDLAFKSKVLILFQKLPQLSLLQTWKRFLQRQFSESALRFTIFCWLKLKDHTNHEANMLDN